MRVEIDYKRDPSYPLLAKYYGEREAIQIIASGIPINRPGVVPSLQVPAYQSNCDGIPQSLLAKVRSSGLSGPCDPSPVWCDFMPFSDTVSACAPIDPRACQASQFGPAMSDANRQAALTAGDQGVAAYCRSNPAECAAYENWQNQADLLTRTTKTLTTAALIGGGLLLVAMAIR